MRLLVTGGSGFIGSALIRFLVAESDAEVVNLDKLTYAASPEALASVQGHARYRFEKGDVCDGPALRHVLETHQPEAVMHLAAESHVDRSIDAPADFIQTNIVGTYTLLQECLRYFQSLPAERRRKFRYHHVSTDETFGSLQPADPAFSEQSTYRPNSPYAASKASADHLTRAWHHTFGLPVIVTNCSNNYGPFQFPEKLIPLMVIKGLSGEPMPVYGDGRNIRDWLHVTDHARALWTVLNRGRVGQSYNIGGKSELTNLDLVERLADLLDRIVPRPGAAPRRELIRFVTDRPGHDRRYAIDCSKIEAELGWAPRETFETGLDKTIRWYVDHAAWWQEILRGRYGGERLGLGAASDKEALK